MQERTRVVFPKSQYETFENVYAGRLQQYYLRKNLPMIHARRPKNTHYRGFSGEVDRQDPRPPFRPEISVVSQVVFYFAAPGEKKGEEKKKKREKK